MIIIIYIYIKINLILNYKQLIYLKKIYKYKIIKIIQIKKIKFKNYLYFHILNILCLIKFCFLIDSYLLSIIYNLCYLFIFKEYKLLFIIKVIIIINTIYLTL